MSAQMKKTTKQMNERVVTPRRPHHLRARDFVPPAVEGRAIAPHIHWSIGPYVGPYIDPLVHWSIGPFIFFSEPQLISGVISLRQSFKENTVFSEFMMKPHHHHHHHHQVESKYMRVRAHAPHCVPGTP